MAMPKSFITPLDGRCGALIEFNVPMDFATLPEPDKLFDVSIVPFKVPHRPKYKPQPPESQKRYLESAVPDEEQGTIKYSW